MALEDLTGPNKFIDALVPTNPDPNDPLDEGNFHISGTKNVLLNTFPSINAAVTLTPAQLNNVPNALYNNADASIGGNIVYTFNNSDSSIAHFQFNQPVGQFYLAYALRGATWSGISFGADGSVALAASSGAASATLAPAGSFSVAGDVIAAGSLISTGESFAVRNSNTAQDRYAQLYQNATLYPALSLYWGGIGQYDAAMDSVGSMVFFPGGNIATWVVEFRQDGLTRFRYGVRIENGTRQSTGVTTAAGAADVGKAPGIARGRLQCDANGDIFPVYPFPISGAHVMGMAIGPGAPVTVILIAESQAGCTLRASIWNGSTFIAWAGGYVDWVAVPDGVAPG